MPRRTNGAWFPFVIAVASSCAASREPPRTPAAPPASRAASTPRRAPAARTPAASPELVAPRGDARSVSAAELCFSQARVAREGDWLHVDAGGMRAVVAGDASPFAELDLVYRGPSTKSTPLASGELRRQIGLKLRAKNTCNVVYVMWHAEPTGGIHVSVKQNDGASWHAECGDHGYVNVQPTRSTRVRAIAPDERRRLRAAIDGSTLRIEVDATQVWEGELPAGALSFDGPAGIRTDNGIFDFDLRVPQARTPGARCASW
jgi:hypothetical protein